MQSWQTAGSQCGSVVYHCSMAGSRIILSTDTSPDYPKFNSPIPYLMTCLPEVGYPIPEVTWYKDGALLEDFGNYMLPRFMLVIFKVTEEETGNYTCLARNPYETLQRSFIISEGNCSNAMSIIQDLYKIL